MRTLVVLIAIAACATGPRASDVRFANAPPVEVVNDRHDVPRAPRPRTLVRALYHLDGSILGPVLRALSMPTPRRALGINALDEVPDSTWFTNRIGVRALTPDDVARGPATLPSPEAFTPWTIKSSKVGGRSVGFVIEDARGETYLLKFDPLGFPEAETAADAITSRLLWAAGYNVPEDHVVYFRPEDLVLSAKAVQKDVFGTKRPLTARDLAARLREIEHEADGRIRGLVSRMLPGTWLGGHPATGVRADDPNDRIPHERRRDLRGARALFAWLDHVDVQEGNYLDMWTEDPADPDRHYVTHYLVDFGKSLGFMSTFGRDPRRSYAYAIDYGEILGSFLSGGLLERGWERRRGPSYRGLGLFDADSYDPGRWKPYTPAYVPFLEADRFDQYWGAKIAIRFTRAQIEAAVATARLSDPRAAAYLVETLVARQRKTAAYWFGQVAPLERFSIESTTDGEALCFDDLALVHALSSPLATRYVVTSHDHEERVRHGPVRVAPGTARTCVSIRISGGETSYGVIEVGVIRPVGLRTIDVHVARDPATHVPRVVGLWRR